MKIYIFMFDDKSSLLWLSDKVLQQHRVYSCSSKLIAHPSANIC